VVILGVSGRVRDAAAAVAIDGKAVAAAGEAELRGVGEIGYRTTGGLPRQAIEFCLRQAGVSSRAVDLVVFVDERRVTANGVQAEITQRGGRELERRRTQWLPFEFDTRVMWTGAASAAASLTAAAMPAADGTVVVLDSGAREGGGIFRKRGGDVLFFHGIAGLPHLFDLVHRVAATLGVDNSHGPEIDALVDLAALDPETTADGASARTNDAAQPPIAWRDGEVHFDAAALARTVQALTDAAPGPLHAANSPHMELQRRRRRLAAVAVHALADTVSALLSDARERTKLPALGVGGDLFASPAFNTLVRQRLGEPVWFSPVPERSGLALGAALALSEAGHRNGMLSHLGLGPAFDEDAIKATLDNCRVDYVYEPHWPRLLARASQLLSRGKVIAWFQGAMDFGPRSLGGRSILCDPSSRYARHNVNEYLFTRPLDTPLAVSVRREDFASCFTGGIDSPFMSLRAEAMPDCRTSLTAALDAQHRCTVHTVDRAGAPQLWDLLSTHRERTGVAGLIHEALRAEAQPIAVTPRAAVRTLFSSAIDALVIGRFLLMKDYWLLRSEWPT